MTERHHASFHGLTWLDALSLCSFPHEPSPLAPLSNQHRSARSESVSQYTPSVDKKGIDKTGTPAHTPTRVYLCVCVCVSACLCAQVEWRQGAVRCGAVR
mmetsp:Transcript_51103/g.128241  ORF Transcript_51103/g.128241 Transcript_51103/m.128241 type:complete len:100 (-) Transcript_51103:147-446(-)